MGTFIHCKKILGVLALSALLLGSANNAWAADQEPLAILQLDADGDGQQETVELYGEQMVSGSSYQHDLLLLLKNSGGELLTAYVPSVKGGYACTLEKASFVGRGEQLILAVGQGGSEDATEYRIIDFADAKKVHELFTGSDNAGVVATASYSPGFKSKLVFADGKSREEPLPGTSTFYEQRGLYTSDGTLLKSYRRPEIGRIASLVTVDMDGDGTLELLSLQNVIGLSKDDLLGKLAGVWSYSKDKGWELKNKIYYSGGKNKDDKFHRSYNEKNWRIFSRQAVYNSNSVTYPVFLSANDAELQNKVNKYFATLAAPYLQQLGYGGCELDYTLTFVGDNFISMVFFGVMDEDNKEIFAKLPVNINVQTGEQLAIGDVLNLKDPDLLPVLRLLTKKEQVDFSNGIPKSWYYNGTNIVFCQRNQEGEWLEAVAAVMDLKKFLLKPELFQKTDWPVSK